MMGKSRFTLWAAWFLAESLTVAFFVRAHSPVLGLDHRRADSPVLGFDHRLEPAPSCIQDDIGALFVATPHGLYRFRPFVGGLSTAGADLLSLDLACKSIEAAKVYQLPTAFAWAGGRLAFSLSTVDKQGEDDVPVHSLAISDGTGRATVREGDFRGLHAEGNDFAAYSLAFGQLQPVFVSEKGVTERKLRSHRLRDGEQIIWTEGGPWFWAAREDQWFTARPPTTPLVHDHNGAPVLLPEGAEMLWSASFVEAGFDPFLAPRDLPHELAPVRGHPDDLVDKHGHFKQARYRQDPVSNYPGFQTHFVDRHGHFQLTRMRDYAVLAVNYAGEVVPLDPAPTRCKAELADGQLWARCGHTPTRVSLGATDDSAAEVIPFGIDELIRTPTNAVLARADGTFKALAGGGTPGGGHRKIRAEPGEPTRPGRVMLLQILLGLFAAVGLAPLVVAFARVVERRLRLRQIRHHPDFSNAILRLENPGTLTDAELIIGDHAIPLVPGYRLVGEESEFLDRSAVIVAASVVGDEDAGPFRSADRHIDPSRPTYIVGREPPSGALWNRHFDARLQTRVLFAQAAAASLFHLLI